MALHHSLDVVSVIVTCNLDFLRKPFLLWEPEIVLDDSTGFRFRVGIALTCETPEPPMEQVFLRTSLRVHDDAIVNHFPLERTKQALLQSFLCCGRGLTPHRLMGALPDQRTSTAAA